jgi:hypothetical protein
MDTATGCRPDGFRTRRMARKAAWLRADPGKHVEPIHCDSCGLWHLTTTTVKDQP